MAEYHYICLLRGINVGGHNIIKMDMLKKSFEELKFHNVVSYIQSGNIIFSSEISDVATITQMIEKKLSKDFSYAATVAVITNNDIQNIVKKAPADFGKENETHRYDVIYFIHQQQPEDYKNSLPMVEKEESFKISKHAIYFKRLIRTNTKSSLDKLASGKLSKIITIRNWNTTLKLAELIGAR